MPQNIECLILSSIAFLVLGCDGSSPTAATTPASANSPNAPGPPSTATGKLSLSPPGPRRTQQELLARITELSQHKKVVANPIPTVPVAGGKPFKLNDRGEVVAIDLRYSAATDDDLARIKESTQLERIDLTGTDVTDTGLSHL